MNNKMSNWFKLPVKCEHILGDDIGSAKDAISIRNVAILSSHHVEKAAHAINSHDRLTARVAELEAALVKIRDMPMVEIDEASLIAERALNNDKNS